MARKQWPLQILYRHRLDTQEKLRNDEDLDSPHSCLFDCCCNVWNLWRLRRLPFWSCRIRWNRRWTPRLRWWRLRRWTRRRLRRSLRRSLWQRISLVINHLWNESAKLNYFKDKIFGNY
ncbi:Uncharacterised protein r2_g797 [Pycnogonum litorale]